MANSRVTRNKSKVQSNRPTNKIKLKMNPARVIKRKKNAKSININKNAIAMQCSVNLTILNNDKYATKKQIDLTTMLLEMETKVTPEMGANNNALKNDTNATSTKIDENMTMSMEMETNLTATETDSNVTTTQKCIEAKITQKCAEEKKKNRRRQCEEYVPQSTPMEFRHNVGN